MKTIKNFKLIVILTMAVGIASCSKNKDDATPDNVQLTNSVQLFLSDNSLIDLKGKDVPATYTNEKLNINFNQNGAEFHIALPNYDLKAAQKNYNNATAEFTLKKDSYSYDAVNIFIPVMVGNSPTPQYISGQTIKIIASNLKVDEHTTDVSVLIQTGSTLISKPVSNGLAPVAHTIDFIQGNGGKPNIITVRIKN